MNCSLSSAPSGHLVALDQQRLQSGDFCAQLSDQPHVAVLVDGGLVDDVLGSVGVSQSAERLAVVHVGGGDRCEDNVNRMTSNISVSLEEFECRRVVRRSLLTGDHDGLGVSAQTVFQQPRQHRVSVGDEHRLLLQVGVHAVLRHVSWTHTQETHQSTTHTHTHIDECFKADCRPASLTQRRDDVAEGNQRLVDVPSFLQSDAGRSGGVGSLAAGQIDQVDLTDRLTGHLCIELSLTETETEREMSQFEYLRCDTRFFSLTSAKSSRPA